MKRRKIVGYISILSYPLLERFEQIVLLYQEQPIFMVLMKCCNFFSLSSFMSLSFSLMGQLLYRDKEMKENDSEMNFLSLSLCNLFHCNGYARMEDERMKE